MHARALTSPPVIEQTNRVATGPFKDTDPRFCVRCHGPNAAKGSTQATLPLPSHEGISCATCHQFDGDTSPGSAGVEGAFDQGLKGPGTVYGPFDDPAPTSAHATSKGRVYFNANNLCASCHDVHAGDLKLQTTFSEWLEYKAAGGQGTCISCHMPVRKDVTRAATAGPPRAVHDHSFVGVDAPHDLASDPTSGARKDLLYSAASMRLTNVTDAGFDVEIINDNTGHNLPSGFAFARQMWIEAIVTDASGTEIFASGKIARDSDDLCDATELSRFQRGCAAIDRQLVSFQQRLLDASGAETVLQDPRGKVVPRQRAIDGVPVTTIPAGQSRTFRYQVTGGARVRVRLLFRAYAPYFLRALDQSVDRLEVYEMASDEVAR
jgi:hypothetical protein